MNEKGNSTLKVCEQKFKYLNKTTEIYTHVSNKMLSKVKLPI